MFEQPGNTNQNPEYEVKLNINNVIGVYIGTWVKRGLMMRIIENSIYLLIYLLNVTANRTAMYTCKVRSVEASNWEVHSVICLCTDTVSNAENITLRVGRIRNTDLKTMRNQSVVSKFKLLSRNLPKSEKKHETGLDSRYESQELNPGFHGRSDIHLIPVIRHWYPFNTFYARFFYLPQFHQFQMRPSRSAAPHFSPVSQPNHQQVLAEEPVVSDGRKVNEDRPGDGRKFCFYSFSKTTTGLRQPCWS